MLAISKMYEESAGLSPYAVAPEAAAEPEAPAAQEEPAGPDYRKQREDLLAYIHQVIAKGGVKTKNAIRKAMADKGFATFGDIPDGSLADARASIEAVVASQEAV
jgi:hypothetical protein